ncbi:MAG TPA: hypothetical protein PLQ56_07310 [Aggregatilineales bacterium]|nr:hypothetical protein [Aggregatilineales bacterium]
MGTWGDTARRRGLPRPDRTARLPQLVGQLQLHQQMSIFLTGKARLVFENCPIRVVFSQRQGMNVFHEDAAFQHLNQQHRDIIAALPRFHYVLDIQDEGLWYLYNRPAAGEIARFQTT